MAATVHLLMQSVLTGHSALAFSASLRLIWTTSVVRGLSTCTLLDLVVNNATVMHSSGEQEPDFQTSRMLS